MTSPLFRDSELESGTDLSESGADSIEACRRENAALQAELSQLKHDNQILRAELEMSLHAAKYFYEESLKSGKH